MAAEVTEGTSDDTHLADDSKRQENAAGYSGSAPPVQAAEATEGTSDDTHLADDSKRQENAASSSGYAPPVQEERRVQNFGDEGEVTIEVVELWELEKCKCPEGTPPMRNLVAGEKTLRCFQCCRPARGPSTD